MNGTGLARFALIAFGAVVVCTAAQGQLSPAAAREFHISLARPAGFQNYAGQQTPHRFGSQLIAVWEHRAENGSGIVYVLGKHSDREFELQTAADSFESFAEDLGLEPERFGNFFVMGRPAAKFVMSGHGDGHGIGALSDSHAGETETYVEIVFVANSSGNTQGTDLLQFVLACPEPMRPAMKAAFSKVVHDTRLRGQGTPAAEPPKHQTEESPPAEPTPTPPEQIEPDSENPPAGPLPGLPVQIEFDPPASYLPPEPPEQRSGTTMFGALYSAAARVPTPVAFQMLFARRSGVTIEWIAPREDNTDLYICIWGDMRQAWVIPGEQFRDMARPNGESFALAYSEELQPYLNNWDAAHDVANAQ